MNKPLTLLGAFGVGAGFMYLIDPDRGRRRRALLQDQVLHLAKTAKRDLGKQSRDLQNRTKGLVAASENYFSRERLSDAQLEAGIRTRLGRVSSHPHAIRTEVVDGKVRLSGQILSGEVDLLVRRVCKMRGVKEIDNQLEIHDSGDNIPALQMNRRTNKNAGEAHSWRNPKLSPATRLLSTTAGVGCMVFAAKRRGLVGLAAGIAGAELLSLGSANSFLEHLGSSRGTGLNLQKAILINAPLKKVYEVCSRPERFPLFMSHVREVRKIGDRHFSWTVDGVAGSALVWDTEITTVTPNEIIKWKSPDGEGIEQTGEMRFERIGDDQTRLHVKLQYHPPAGYLGNVVAWLFRLDPKTETDDDLLRMKSFIETGRIPHDAFAEAQKRRCKNMRIKEIMTVNPACCEPETNLQEVAKLMAEKNCGAIPIVENRENKKPVGVITDRDVTVRAVAEGKNPVSAVARDFMTTSLLTLKPDASVEECCHLMEKNQVRRMLVVDERGALTGIVAQADIARQAPEYETAELVKDISMAAPMAA